MANEKEQRGLYAFPLTEPFGWVWLGKKFFFVDPGGKDRGISLLTSIRFDVAG